MDLLEIYHRLGIDMIIIPPTAFVNPIDFGLYNVGIADIYNVEIKKVMKIITL